MDRVCGEATATLSAAVMLLPWSPAAAQARAGAGWWHREAMRMRTRASLIELPGASPVALRHLDADLTALERLRDEVSRQSPFVRWLASWLPAVGAATRGIDMPLEELDAAIDHRKTWIKRRVLEFSGNGHIVEVLGEMTAKNLVVLVPGVGTNLGNYEDGFFADARALADRLRGTDSSVIAWLGYDPPPSLVTAISTSAAERGADALATFVGSLPPGHVTIVGHSYGSLVVGLAASDDGMVADELVFIGSPGVGSRTISELHLPASTTVWAGLTPLDPIRLARPRCIMEPGSCLTTPDVIFGTDPHTATFGAKTFDVGEAPVWNAHSVYYERGSTALENITRIVVGEDWAVTTG